MEHIQLPAQGAGEAPSASLLSTRGGPLRLYLNTLLPGFTGSFRRSQCLSLAPQLRHGADAASSINAALRLLKATCRTIRLSSGSDEGSGDALYQNKQPRVITKTQNQQQSPTLSQY